MANLPFKTIKLISNPEAVNKGEDPEYKTYYTQGLVPLRVTRNAALAQKELMGADGKADEVEMMDWMIQIVAKDLYKDQFTADEVLDGLEVSNAMNVLQDQMQYAMGAGKSDDTKKFVESKKK